MSKTFLVADACFCDASAAQRHQKSIEDYNNILITNINSSAMPEDTILFMGDIGSYENKDQIKDCINALAAQTKKCIDMRLQTYFNTRDKLKEIGIERGYTIDGFVKDTIYDQKYFVTITSDYEYYKKLFTRPITDGYDYYYAIPASRNKFTKLLDGKCFDISIETWGLHPIEYNSLPQLIDNAKLFEKMEESEHESDI